MALYYLFLVSVQVGESTFKVDAPLAQKLTSLPQLKLKISKPFFGRNVLLFYTFQSMHFYYATAKQA